MARNTELKAVESTENISLDESIDDNAEDSSTDESDVNNVMSSESRLEAHRDSVRRGASARNAAVKLLIDAHKSEFTRYLEIEKEARGIKTWDARRKDRSRREFLKLLQENPELAALVAQREAS